MSRDVQNRGFLPEKNEGYGDRGYWEERYGREETFDWFVGYSSIKGLLLKYVQFADAVLNLGCGNSNLPMEMWKDGLRNVTNIDYSSVVIEAMEEKSKGMSGLCWIVVDIFNMSEKFRPGSFDVIIEKGTLDALLVSESDPWNYSVEAEDMLDKILQQVSDLLTPGGRFLSITFSQPHFRLPFYSLSKYGWSVHVETIGKDFHYFCYVLTKGESLTESNHICRINYFKRKDNCLKSVAPISDDDDEDFLLKNIELLE